MQNLSGTLLSMHHLNIVKLPRMQEIQILQLKRAQEFFTLKLQRMQKNYMLPLGFAVCNVLNPPHFVDSPAIFNHFWLKDTTCVASFGSRPKKIWGKSSLQDFFLDSSWIWHCDPMHNVSHRSVRTLGSSNQMHILSFCISKSDHHDSSSNVAKHLPRKLDLSQSNLFLNQDPY